MSADRIAPFSDVALLRRAWRPLFASTDPFDVPFRSDVEECMLFHPTEGYHLTEAQYTAVVEGARQAGDTRFFLSVVEYSGDYMEKGQHWACEFPPYKDYLGLPLNLENALYSPRSRWGVLVSHEEHALAGGGQEFMRKVRELYPEWPKDAERLRQTWANNPNAAWVEATLGKIAKRRW